MWIASSFGFLMPAVRPPKTVAKGDDRTLQVRARRAKDLDILRAEYMKGKLGPTIHTPKFDYEYRAYCTPESFAWAMATMIMEIDYLKFKPTTDRYGDDELHTMYNSMWSTILAHLSTRYHQYSYWNYHKDGQRYAAENEAAGKPTPGKVYGGGTTSKTGTGFTATAGNTGYGATSGAGYPKAVGTVSSASSDSFDEAAAEYDRLQRWFEDAESNKLAGSGGQRNTSATRDDDAREPDVIDVEWGDDDTAQSRSSALARVDKLQEEIDAILDQAGPIDHALCRHRQSANAKAKCRARHRNAAMKEIGKLRDEIEAAYRDAEADFEAEKASEPALYALP